MTCDNLEARIYRNVSEVLFLIYDLFFRCFCLLYRFGPFAAAVTLGCSPKFRFGNDSQRQKGKHCKMIDRMGKRECMLFFLCSSLNFSLLLSTSLYFFHKLLPFFRFFRFLCFLCFNCWIFVDNGFACSER
jgi:hypothetical protein